MCPPGKPSSASLLAGALAKTLERRIPHAPRVLPIWVVHGPSANRNEDGFSPVARLRKLTVPTAAKSSLNYLLGAVREKRSLRTGLCPVEMEDCARSARALERERRLRSLHLRQHLVHVEPFLGGTCGRGRVCKTGRRVESPESTILQLSERN